MGITALFGMLLMGVRMLNEKCIASFQNHRLRKNGSEGVVTAAVRLGHVENIHIGGGPMLMVGCSVLLRARRSPSVRTA